MDQPYEPVADWLSKFYAASEPIQALWILALIAVPLGMTWLLMRGLREIVLPLARCGRGRLLYGVYLDPQGRYAIYRDDRLHEVPPVHPAPPEPAGQAIRGPFHRPGK